MARAAKVENIIMQKNEVFGTKKVVDEMNINEESVLETEKNAVEDDVPEAIDVTSLPGVGAATAEKLQSSGFHDVLSIAVASPGKLCEAAGVSEAVARKIINAARDSMKMGFETGTQVLARRAKVMRIPTGSSNIDALLGGGFETGAITECFGEFGSGKTQIGHVLVVQVLSRDPKASVVYIDTENTFRPERIKELCVGVGLDYEDALRRIMVARAYNSDHQMLLAEKVEGLIKEQGKKIKLVVVDSLTAHFRAEFIGRGTLAERQQKLNRHMHTLGKLSSSQNICVFVTNQVMSKPDSFFGDPTVAIGGHIVAHASTFRIYLRKGRKGSRVAKLIDSPNLPEGEAPFEVTGPGLKDF
ncbi:DNA repair and recombination protein RadA [archaeon]|jgi:DNA repair protein RadA|nr:DNA repair and recombination protein RadA [archaeon]MBT6697782.1 DNA repair and recombination protein RadA [archaeon]